MIIQKQINNPHVLLKKLRKHLGAEIGFSTGGGKIEFHNLPDIVDREQLRQFILDWAEEKTDSEEIAEEQGLSEEKKLFLQIASAFKPTALEQILKPGALTKLKAWQDEETNT